MAVLDRPLRKVAATLIKRFGARLEYRRIVQGAYDSVAGRRVQTVTRVPDVPATVGQAQQDLYGTAVKAGDWIVDIAALDLSHNDVLFAPTTNDVIVVDNTALRVMSMVPVYSGDEVALYKLVARR